MVFKSPVEIGENVQFDASGCTDIDCTIVSYRWGFGDGTTAEGMSVTHVYSSSGEYDVILEVIDSAMYTKTGIWVITVKSNSS